LSTALSTTATMWVSTCSSFNTGTAYYSLDVNGAVVSGVLANMAVPDQLSINGNIYVDAEWSNFGVSEFIVWNRAISSTELRGAQTYLTQKYGLTMKAPPAPPVPAAPQPPQPPMASSLANGMVAWCVCLLHVCCMGVCHAAMPRADARHAAGCAGTP
jgi:hypothetical protein